VTIVIDKCITKATYLVPSTNMDVFGTIHVSYPKHECLKGTKHMSSLQNMMF
jgi:hypothetical protein